MGKERWEGKGDEIHDTEKIQYLDFPKGADREGWVRVKRNRVVGGRDNKNTF